MGTTCYIAKCSDKSKPNWIGHGFSNSPAMIYKSLAGLLSELQRRCSEDISSIWTESTISIIPLTNIEVARMIMNEEAFL